MTGDSKIDKNKLKLLSDLVSNYANYQYMREAERLQEKT